MVAILAYWAARLARRVFGGLSGISPIFSAPNPLLSNLGAVLPVVHYEPLSCALVEGAGVAVAQLELDVLVIRFNGFGTNPKFLRDPGGSEARSVQRKNMQFAVGQARYL